MAVFTNKNDIQEKIVSSCSKLYGLLKSSLGPVGLDKMIIDEYGEITITNDGAKIIKMLEKKDPFSKIFSTVSLQQEKQAGDGTTSVILVAYELLQRGQKLLDNNVHPSIIISSFRVAMSYCSFLIRRKLSIKIETKDVVLLLGIAKTCLQSKISGLKCRKFARIAVEAVQSVATVRKGGKSLKCQVGAIKYVKIRGQNMSASRMIDGIILEDKDFINTKSSFVSPARILFSQKGFSFEDKMSSGINSFDKLEQIWDQKIGQQKKAIKFCSAFTQKGVNLILSTKGVDDIYSKYLCDEGIDLIRRISSEDLKKILFLSGGKIIKLIDTVLIEENLKKILGEVEEVFEQNFSCNKIMVFRGFKLSTGSCILARGANEQILGELVRSLDDAIFCVMNTLEGKRVVPGGSATETNLAVELERLASLIGSREQLPILEYAESLLIVGKCLLNNSGCNSREMLSNMKLIHSASLKEICSRFSRFGIDLPSGQIRDNFVSGILEPAQNKISCLQIATEAAIAFLRIDDIIGY